MHTIFEATKTRAGWPDLIAVDEGLDRLFRWCAKTDAILWSTALDTKCRTLQSLPDECVLGADDRGYFEASLADGVIARRAILAPGGGVTAAARKDDGATFLAGLNLAGKTGITFAEYDHGDRLARVVAFPGDYVRGATLTGADTILFTNDYRVLEGDWSGRILREFSAPGFKHAWKSVRLPNGHTLISAGYGACLVEFDSHTRAVRRSEVPADLGFVRPFFFGDFAPTPDGGLIVCNWLGHGPGLGGTGCPLLRFDSAGSLTQVWQDPLRTSSVQAFVLLNA